MDAKELSKIFKALSHPNRLELYLHIARKYEASFETGGECFLADIIDSFKIGAPTISHHLKELANAGLIVSEKRGKFLVCKVNEHIAEEVFKMLELTKEEQ